jgi:sec-independent protein translocase protein TatA
MGSIGVPELLIVLAIVVLILGPKRIPRAGRAIGSGIREFKDSITKNSDDDDLGLPGPSTASTEPEAVDGEVVRDQR